VSGGSETREHSRLTYKGNGKDRGFHTIVLEITDKRCSRTQHRDVGSVLSNKQSRHISNTRNTTCFDPFRESSSGAYKEIKTIHIR
jgi:hypothetical protein